jgi:hypothetical protein
VVRLVKDPTTAHRVDLDVVTHDPRKDAGLVASADRDADVRSMFDDVHLGLGEGGRRSDCRL